MVFFLAAKQCEMRTNWNVDGQIKYLMWPIYQSELQTQMILLAWTIKITSNRMKLKLFHWSKSTAAQRNGFVHARVSATMSDSCSHCESSCQRKCFTFWFVRINCTIKMTGSQHRWHIFFRFSFGNGVFFLLFSLSIYREKRNNEIAFAQKKAQHSVCVSPATFYSTEWSHYGLNAWRIRIEKSSAYAVNIESTHKKKWYTFELRFKFMHINRWKFYFPYIYTPLERCFDVAKSKHKILKTWLYFAAAWIRLKANAFPDGRTRMIYRWKCALFLATIRNWISVSRCARLLKLGAVESQLRRLNTDASVMLDFYPFYESKLPTEIIYRQR